MWSVQYNPFFPLTKFAIRIFVITNNFYFQYAFPGSYEEPVTLPVSTMVTRVLSSSKPGLRQAILLKYSAVYSDPQGSVQEYWHRISVVFLNRLKRSVIFLIPPGYYFLLGGLLRSDLERKRLVKNILHFINF